MDHREPEPAVILGLRREERIEGTRTGRLSLSAGIPRARAVVPPQPRLDPPARSRLSSSHSSPRTPLRYPDPPPDRETLAAHRRLVTGWHFQDQLARYGRDLAAIRAFAAHHDNASDDF